MLDYNVAKVSTLNIPTLRVSPGSLLCLLWAVFALIVISTKIHLSPTAGNVFNIYRQAGIDWLAGSNLYEDGRFLYLPTAALVFTAFGKIPFTLGAALWRAINISIFALGIYSLSGSQTKSPGKARINALIASFIAICLSWSAARHGQMTLAMSGFMMIACSQIMAKNWLRAALALVVAVALKPLAIVLLLATLVLYRALAFRIMFILAGVVLLPFLFQEASFVFEQYLSFPQVLVAQTNRSLSHPFLQIFTTLEYLGVELTLFYQTCIRICFAFLTLFFIWKVTKRENEASNGLLIYSIAAIYILLFGTGTEANTYALIAPVLGLICSGFFLSKNFKALLPYLGVILVILVSRFFKVAYPETILAMLKPIATLFLAVLIVKRQRLLRLSQSNYFQIRALSSFR